MYYYARSDPEIFFAKKNPRTLAYMQKLLYLCTVFYKLRVYIDNF